MSKSKAALLAEGKAARAEQEVHARGSRKWNALEKKVRAVSDALQEILAKELRDERDAYLVSLGYEPKAKR